MAAIDFKTDMELGINICEYLEHSSTKWGTVPFLNKSWGDYLNRTNLCIMYFDAVVIIQKRYQSYWFWVCVCLCWWKPNFAAYDACFQVKVTLTLMSSSCWWSTEWRENLKTPNFETCSQPLTKIKVDTLTRRSWRWVHQSFDRQS